MDSSPQLLVSVVVCTYNRAPLLPVALRSVLDQSYEQFELVVVDDGSVDDTAGVVAALGDPRVRYVHQENQGLGAARNTGVAGATGRYVVFLDDDDRALPGWLEHLARLLETGCAVACCGATIARDDGTVIEVVLPQPLGPAFADYTAWFQPGTFAVRRDAYLAVGGFDAELPHLEHTEFFLRLLPECRRQGWEVLSVAEPLVELHVGGDRRTTLPRVQRINEAMAILLRRHHDRFALDDQMWARFEVVAGVSAAQTGDFGAARRHLWQAVRIRPRRWKDWARLGLAAVPPVGRRVWGRQLGTGQEVLAWSAPAPSSAGAAPGATPVADSLVPGPSARGSGGR